MKVALAVVGALVALALAGNVIHEMEAKRADEATKVAQAEKIRVAQEKRSALTAELQANKLALLSGAKSLIDQGDPAAALASIAKFVSLGDADVMRLRELATKKVAVDLRIKQLMDELAQKPPPSRAMVIYTEMAVLEPTNARWPFAIQEARPALAALEAHNAALKKTADRKESVRLLFSAWDGSVKSVEDGIKMRLKDPDSYKHIQTKFKDSGLGNVTVFTQYSARNSFNAVVPNTATAEVSPTGELVSIYLDK